MKKRYLVLFFIMVALKSFAQPTNKTSEIPLVRSYFHDKINETQLRIFKADWINDSLFTPTTNHELNAKLTYAVINTVDSIQTLIEANKQTDNNFKIKLLRGLNECLQSYITEYRYRKIKPVILIDLLTAYAEALKLDSDNESIEPVISKYSYEVDDILLHCVAFSTNAGIEASNNTVLLKYFQDDARKGIMALSKHPEYSSADSLIVVIAHRYPDELYTYAAAYNAFSNKINSNPDSLVQIICRMSKMKSGRQYFPFLDDIYRGKTTFEQIDSALRDSSKYYSLLVQTAIEYADRMRQRDTPISLMALNHKLAFKAKEVYINEINGLHELPDNIRFKKIDNLTPQELYYLAVMGSEEIYTSSYVRGVYTRLWKNKMQKSDSLLLSVKFDHFRKWIKIAANYNTLDDFLKRMDKGNAQLLMKAFINNLDKTESLEDAVDVADSYASISDNDVRKLILNQVQYNLQQAQKSNNKKATAIYSILNTLFLSIDTSNHIDLTAALGIPPVFFMPNKLMQDTAGRIIIEQFFYGDKDGQGIFNYFLNGYKNASWKITMTDNWALISSTKGTPVRIYANRPLDEEKGLDEKAQEALNNYLYDNDLNPTMVIHRGHSYYLNSTLEKLASSARIVLLGSCGGYQSLSKILETCPSAQIISSKQTGSGTINGPMINIIIESLRQGKDINWVQMWKTFSTVFGSEKAADYFNDYVPPHKNLGAVFIMAYTKQQEIESGENAGIQ